MNDVKLPVTHYVSRTSEDMIASIASKLNLTKSEALETLVGQLANQVLAESRPPEDEPIEELGETDETTTIEQRLTWTEDQLMALDELINLGSVREKLHSLELWIDSLISKLERTRL